MNKVETTRFIRETYLLIKDEYKLTQNEFHTLLGIDRRMFLHVQKPDYLRGLNLIRLVRRLCHLLRDKELRSHVMEWLQEVKNKEIYEEWHGKTYSGEVRTMLNDGHADRKSP